jgi:hypothetical protein
MLTLKTRFWPWLILTGIFWGLSIGTKINQLVFAPGIFLALLLRNLSKPTTNNRQPTTSKTNFKLLTSILNFALCTLHSLLQFLPLILIALSIWALTNPHILADQNKFLSMLDYEGGLARGQIITFYTRQFINTTPLVFQATRVYPWILSWPVFLLGTIGLLVMLLKGTKRFVQILINPKSKSPRSQFLVTCYLLLVPVWGLVQLATIGTLYVKWTRYLIPTLPYFVLATTWLLNKLHNNHVKTRHPEATIESKLQQSPKNLLQSPNLHYVLCALVITTQALWTLAFFTIYTRPDPRIAAANWAKQNLDPQAHTLSEVYDMGITTFSPYMQKIKLFNFYELDDPGHRPTRQRQLRNILPNTQVIIVNSRRIWKNALDHPDQFPEAARFYTQLFDGSLGFTKVADFTNFPQLGPLVFNTELLAEETFSVFDHPHVMIFQKQQVHITNHRPSP